MPNYLPVKRAAAQIINQKTGEPGVSVRRVHQLINKGLLKTVEVEGLREHLIDQAELDRFKELNRPQGQPRKKA